MIFSVLTERSRLFEEEAKKKDMSKPEDTPLVNTLKIKEQQIAAKCWLPSHTEKTKDVCPWCKPQFWHREDIGGKSYILLKLEILTNVGPACCPGTIL